MPQPSPAPLSLPAQLDAPAREAAAAPGGRIASLDGVRALSILLVVVGHARHALPELSGGALAAASLLGNQSLGVSAFFVLSGFLITTLLVREQEATGTVHLGHFYLRRAFRILPPFYAYVAIIAALSVARGWDIPAGHFLSALTFTWNYAPGTEGWWLGHGWSLSVEEQFYLFWPLLLRALGRRRGTWAALALVLAAPALRLATYALLPEWRGRIPIMLHTRVDALMVGCLLALLPWEGAVLRGARRLLALRAHWVAAAFVFVGSPLLTERWRGAWLLPVGYSAEALCLALLLFWVVSEPDSAVGRVLNSRPAVHLGALSYSLYLWQQPFTEPDFSHRPGVFPLNLLGAWLAAEASHRLLEKGFLRLRQRFFPSA
ncbi:acyltransferase [Myxococcaceae bacterium GXIMD 01537]